MAQDTSQGTDIVIRLLAAGYPVQEVATTLGTDAEVILAVKEEYHQQIEDARAGLHGTTGAITTPTKYTPSDDDDPLGALSHDQKIDYAEGLLLDKLITALPLEVNSGKIAKLLQMVNSMKRRGVGEGATGPVTIDNRQVVVLNMPEHVKRVPEYQLNSSNEVVAVDGEALAVASTKHVQQLAGLAVEEAVTHEKREQICTESRQATG